MHKVKQCEYVYGESERAFFDAVGDSPSYDEQTGRCDSEATHNHLCLHHALEQAIENNDLQEFLEGLSREHNDHDLQEFLKGHRIIGGSPSPTS